MGAFVGMLHACGCPPVLIKIIYYILVLDPIETGHLVDSLEVFSGEANYTKVNLVITEVAQKQLKLWLVGVYATVCLIMFFLSLPVCLVASARLSLDPCMLLCPCPCQASATCLTIARTKEACTDQETNGLRQLNTRGWGLCRKRSNTQIEGP